MKSFTPLWNGLVDSSIWEEPDHVFRVFMAMLSLKDANHQVTMDGYKLAKRIHMPVDKVEDALKILESPDRRRPDQEFEGRRIKKVEGVWEILNGEFYRQMVSEEMRKARNRRSQAAWRDRQKLKSKPLPGETASIKLADTHGPEAAVEHQERIDAELGERAKNGPGWSSEVNDFEDHVKERLSSPEGLAAQAALLEEQRAARKELDKQQIKAYCDRKAVAVARIAQKCLDVQMMSDEKGVLVPDPGLKNGETPAQRAEREYLESRGLTGQSPH